LLGLFTGAKAEGLHADYAKPVEQVFTSLAAYIATKFSVKPLLARISTLDSKTLPSWGDLRRKFRFKGLFMFPMLAGVIIAELGMNSMKLDLGFLDGSRGRVEIMEICLV
jgi:hypothetical protein